MRKLGLIAGGGRLPITIAQHCRSIDRPLFVVRLDGFADPDLKAFDGRDLGIARVGATLEALRAAGCQSVCFAGHVARPDFRALRPDARGLAALPGAIMAARRGDDALLAYMLGVFESEGFAVEGAQEVMADLILTTGPLGRRTPGRDDRADILRAMEAARAIGRLDAGQGAVCCDGLILALEAQEGTDAMLTRVAGLRSSIRGTPARRRGVLAKACKPTQERRVDLPTIGVDTIRHAAEAGLAGVAGESGLTLVLDRFEVASLADELGLFVVGVERLAT